MWQWQLLNVAIIGLCWVLIWINEEDSGGDIGPLPPPPPIFQNPVP